MKESLNLHYPALWKRVAERLRVREVRPDDICSKDQKGKLFQVYPDLAGDQSEVDIGLGGNCQSWRGCRGWWRSVIEETNNPSSAFNLDRYLDSLTLRQGSESTLKNLKG